MFKDNVFAFERGPICYDTYQTFKKCSQYEVISLFEDEMIARSRIIASSNGIEKLRIIDSTLEKYGEFSADELVDITRFTIL